MIAYFIYMAIRDLLYVTIQFVKGEFLGFWKVVALQVLNVPIDCMLLFFMSTLSAISLGRQAAVSCADNNDCKDFLGPARISTVLGFAYICFCFSAKCCLFLFFMFALGGLNMLVQDFEEEATYLNIKSQNAGNLAMDNL